MVSNLISSDYWLFGRELWELIFNIIERTTSLSRNYKYIVKLLTIPSSKKQFWNISNFWSFGFGIHWHWIWKSAVVIVEDILERNMKTKKISRADALVIFPNAFSKRHKDSVLFSLSITIWQYTSPNQCPSHIGLLLCLDWLDNQILTALAVYIGRTYVASQEQTLKMAITFACDSPYLYMAIKQLFWEPHQSWSEWTSNCTTDWYLNKK